jgi:hypothetical protein
MNGKKMSCDIIEAEVRKFWEESGYSFDVVAFFYQKYDWETEWCFCSEIVMSDSSYNYDMTFLNDFCEGQTCVKDLKIVPLHDVLEYYAEDRIREK